VIFSDIFPRHAAQQGKLQGPRVVDIRCYVHEVFTEPPQGYRGPEGVPGFEEKDPQQTSGMSSCPSVPPRVCINSPKGLKMMCPAS
jgi:hypothetical protein